MVLLLGSVIRSNATEEESQQQYQADITPTSLRAKEQANYTVVLPKSLRSQSQGNLPLVIVEFPREYNFWMGETLQIRDLSGFKILTEANVAKKDSSTELSFKLSRISAELGSGISFLICDIVNPQTPSNIPGLNIRILDPTTARIRENFHTEPFRLKPIVSSKIKVFNHHTQFLPGFFTSWFQASVSNLYLYQTRVRVRTDHPLIEAVPAEFVLVAASPINRLQTDEFGFTLETAFKLKIERNAPLGKHSLRFEVLEMNNETHFHPIEKLEFEVTIPEPQLSAAPPAPFKGPKPQMAFGKKSIFAALSSPSAPQLVKLVPSPSEPVMLQVKTTLPDQPDTIQFQPGMLNISSEVGEARFIVIPKVGAVSGNLHLHIPDPFYRTHIQILQRRASLEVVYAEVEQEQLRLTVDSRTLHNITFGPFSLAKASKLATNFSRDIQVQSSITFGVTHQVMVMFVFIKNISRLATDRLLLPKLRDLSPLLNGTFMDLGDNTGVYFAYPEYSADHQSHVLELDVSRQEFLSYSDFKIIPMFRDCQGEIFLVDYYFKKIENYSLKLMKLNFDAPAGISQAQFLRIMEATTSLKGNLAGATPPNSTQRPVTDGTLTSSSLELDQNSRQRHSFVLLTEYPASKVEQLLQNTVLNKKNVPSLRYYVYLESSTVVASNKDWVTLHSVEELDMSTVNLEIHLEDLGEKFIHYGLHLSLGALQDFKPFLNFTALLRIKKHHYDLDAVDSQHAVEHRDIDDGASRLAVFNQGDLTATSKFYGLNSSEEYLLQARPCIFFKGRSLCAEKAVS